MLKELYEVSQFLDVSPVGFTRAVCHWQIELSPFGDVITPCRVYSDNPKKKPKLGKPLQLPTIARNGTKPILVSDDGSYVFGFGAKGKVRHQMFLDLLGECFAETGEDDISKIIDYLKSVNAEQITQKLVEIDPKTNPEKERFFFTVSGAIVHEKPAIKSFWSKYINASALTKSTQCVVSGQQTNCIVGTIPAKLKGVQGANAAGAALISFDKKPYQSWGLSACENAPIALDVALQSINAIEKLLSMPETHIRMNDGTILVWGNAGEGINPDFMSGDFEYSVNSPVRWFKHPHRQENGIRPDSSVFYFAFLKGNAGRVALGAFVSRNTDEITKSVEQFCKLQRRVLPEQFRIYPVWRLAVAGFIDSKQAYLDKVKRQLWRFVLFGEPLPEEYAKRLINRLLCDSVSGGSIQLPKIVGLSIYLGEDMSKSKGFALGRVAYLMHHIECDVKCSSSKQYKGFVSNTIKNLKVLSSTPNQVFQSLMERIYRIYIPELNRKTDKSRNYARMLTDELQPFFEGDAAGFPEVFTIKEQADFFMGWHEMNSQIWKKSEKTEEEE